jgi:phosphate:Na+ symporter
MTSQLWYFGAGLGLFLFAILLLEEALKELAGRKFKHLLQNYTDTSFKSILLGTIATIILRSSSAVTLMLLALVGSKVILFSNALGIILGANLGTTLTGWIVTAFGFKFEVANLVNPMILFGTFGMLFFRKFKTLASWSKFLTGFGLIFFGLEIMKSSTQHLLPYFDPAALQGQPLIVYALAGFLFTTVIQSSSATMAITLTAIHANVIELYPAAALIIGADLGTTVTVIFGALAGSAGKRRVAAAHFGFNLITSILAFALLLPLLKFAVAMAGSEQKLYALVLFHSSFNLIGVVLFSPFLRQFARAIEKMIPESKVRKKTRLDFDSILPEAGLMALRSEAIGILAKIFMLNKHLLDPQDKNSLAEIKTLFDSDSYDECYRLLKITEAEMIHYAHALQEQKLTTEQSRDLKYILSCIRSATMAAKNFKDIKHNLEEFNNSNDQAVFEAYSLMVTRTKDFLTQVPRQLGPELLSEQDTQQIFGHLAQDMALTKSFFLDFNQRIEAQVRARKLPSDFISSLLNANSEIYQACRNLVYSVGDILLPPQQADDLQSL